MADDGKQQTGVAECVCEFVGTFLLCVTVLLTVISGSASTPLAASSTLMICIYCMGPVSGGHFNPAVTIAVALSAGIAPLGAALYIGSQLCAGVLAGIISTTLKKATGVLLVEDAGQVAGAELLYTFMLCFVVLNCAMAKKNGGNQYFGLAIGFVVMAGGPASSTLSGAVFNPAVALSIDMCGLMNVSKFGWFFVFFGFEALGAILAAGAFRLVRPEHFSDDQLAPSTLGAKLLSEFLGTSMLVVTVALIVAAPAAPDLPQLSIACSLMCMIYALGSVSGAHFNPAVTVAVLCSRRDKISTKEAGCYVMVQLLAGVLAAMFGWQLRGKMGPAAPASDDLWATALVAEFIFTLLLCYTVLAVATTATAAKDMFGISIGFCIVAGAYAAGPLSGGALNPAVSLGLGLASLADHGSDGKWWSCFPYAAVHWVAAAFAAGLLRVTHPQEWVDTPEETRVQSIEVTAMGNA